MAHGAPDLSDCPGLRLRRLKLSRWLISAFERQVHGVNILFFGLICFGLFFFFSSACQPPSARPRSDPEILLLVSNAKLAEGLRYGASRIKFRLETADICGLHINPQ